MSALVVVSVAAFIATLCILAPQRGLMIGSPDKTTGRMLLSDTPLMVEVTPGVKFKFDTGADVSIITEADLRRLQELGYKTTPGTNFGCGRDGYGRYGIYTKSVSVDLPLVDYEFGVDTTGRTIIVGGPYEVNTLENLDLFVTKDGISTIGIDVMERFMVEYKYAERTVSLMNILPPGYQKIVEIHRSVNPLYKFITGNRYYMNIGVEHSYNDYFLDTGQQLAMLKLPGKEAERAGNVLRPDTIRTFIGNYSSMVDDRSWTEIGHRAGYCVVNYYDNSEEKFAVNPLEIFTQDMLIDFIGCDVYVRPYCVPNVIRISGSSVRK